MKKGTFLLILSIFTFYSLQVKAQTATANKVATPTPYEYYLYVSGLDSKAKVIDFENEIRGHKEVLFFLGNRFPVKYFILRTNVLLTKEVFTTWIKDKSFSLLSYGADAYGKETAIIAYLHDPKVEKK